MISGVVDTHAIIWYLFDDRRLSTAAQGFIDSAGERGDSIGVSPITLVEVIYLLEKGRLQAGTEPLIISALQSPESVFVEVPFDLAVAQALKRVERSKVPDMPDRIIAATALTLNVPILSRDAQIQVSGIDTIW